MLLTILGIFDFLVAAATAVTLYLYSSKRLKVSNITSEIENVTSTSTSQVTLFTAEASQEEDIYATTVKSLGEIFAVTSTTIIKVSPEGVVTKYADNVVSLNAITIDPAGNIYTTNITSNNVSKITQSGVSTILATTGLSP